jgi:hypothetical protein
MFIFEYLNKCIYDTDYITQIEEKIVYMYVFVYLYLYVCMYIYICVCIYMYMYICAFICIYLDTDVYI